MPGAGRTAAVSGKDAELVQELQGVEVIVSLVDERRVFEVGVIHLRMFGVRGSVRLVSTHAAPRLRRNLLCTKHQACFLAAPAPTPST